VRGAPSGAVFGASPREHRALHVAPSVHRSFAPLVSAQGGAIRTLFSSSCCNCDERDHHGGLDLSAAPAGTRAEAVRMEDTDDALVCGNWYVTIGRWDAGAE
jgi:hypothetical protein